MHDNSLTFPILPCSNNNCRFVEAPALVPPEASIDAEQLRMYEEQLAQAVDVALPDDGDDDI
jgi:hypothetical protein